MRQSRALKLRPWFSGIAGAGFIFLALSLTGCGRSDTESAAAPTPAAIAYGTKISFAQGGNSEPYRVSGWSKTEPKFTWTEGNSAELRIPIAATNDSISLKMTMAGLIKPPELPFQPVEVYANDQKIAEWHVGETADFVAAIPSTITKPGGRLNITFKMPKATSPKALGQSADPRVLGICCLNLELSKD